MNRVIFLLPIVLTICAFGQPATSVDPRPEPTANVVVGGRALFCIRSRVGSFSPAKRAAAASRRLSQFVADSALGTNRIVRQDHDGSTDILAGDVIITTVTDEDAKAARASRTYIRAFRVGERVRIAVTNSLVLGGHIVNYSNSQAGHSLILNTTVTIGYAVPWRMVHGLLITAAKATTDVPEHSGGIQQCGCRDRVTALQRRPRWKRHCDSGKPLGAQISTTFVSRVAGEK